MHHVKAVAAAAAIAVSRQNYCSILSNGHRQTTTTSERKTKKKRAFKKLYTKHAKQKKGATYKFKGKAAKKSRSI